MDNPEKTLTPEQCKHISIASWLKTYSQNYPMYGKSLEPEKAALFFRVLRDLSIESIEAGFEAVLRESGDNFPTAGQVREAAIRHALEKRLEPKPLPLTKDRFLVAASEENSDAETERLRQEFHEMLRGANLRSLPE